MGNIIYVIDGKYFVGFDYSKPSKTGFELWLTNDISKAMAYSKDDKIVAAMIKQCLKPNQTIEIIEK